MNDAIDIRKIKNKLIPENGNQNKKIEITVPPGNSPKISFDTTNKNIKIDIIHN